MNNTYSPSGGMASYSMPNINSLRYNNTNLNFGGYTPPVLSQVRYNRWYDIRKRSMDLVTN